jgi:hypothetical protein
VGPRADLVLAAKIQILSPAGNRSLVVQNIYLTHSYSDLSERRRSSVAIAFQLRFRVTLLGRSENIRTNWNGTFTFGDVTLLCEIINAIKTNIEALLDANKDTDIEINTEKVKCMFMSCLQYAGRNHDLKKTDKILRKCLKFQILEEDSNKSSFIHEEIKSSLK